MKSEQVRSSPKPSHERGSAAHAAKSIASTIAQELLESAKCIAMIPGDMKFAFVFGGNYGRGLATCRRGDMWSAPMFVAIDGGSVGY